MFWLKRKSADKILSLANNARDGRDWRKARQLFELYLEREPEAGPIWVQLGHCLKEMGDLQGAGAAYERALTLMPDDADLHLQVGHLHKLAGRREMAIRSYRKSHELDASGSDARYELEQFGEEVHARQVSGEPQYDPNVLVHPERDRAANLREAGADPDRVAASAKAIATLYKRLPEVFPANEPHLMPKMLHFVFGFKEKGDIPYYGFMAIQSALHFNPGWKAYYYTMHEPQGPNWARVRDRVTLILIEDFDYFGNARLHHYAHKADIVRMVILTAVGGVYLDIDTITQKSYEDLRKHDFVMGVQAAGPNSSSGLANAVMMGKPKAAFSTHWLAQYDYFRSKGRDDLWDYHSVKMPVAMAAERPETIKVLDYRAFFYPLWTSIQKALFSEMSHQYTEDFKPAYCFHLWNGATGEWLDKIDDAFVQTSKSIYAQIARQTLAVTSPTAPPPTPAVPGGKPKSPGKIASSRASRRAAKQMTERSK